VDSFYVYSTSPSNGSTDVIRNVKIRFNFNKTVDAATVTEATFTVNDSEGSVAGIRTVDGRTIEFTPDLVCPDNPCGATNCFADGLAVTAEIVADGILSAGDGLPVTCTISNPCEISFTVGNVIDCEDPSVNLYFDNGQVCVGADNEIFATAQDDSGVANIEFFANEAMIDDLANSDPSNINPFTISTIWDGSGYTVGASMTFKAIAYDLDDHNKSDTKTINLRPAHCCNGIQDEDEAGIDCGGNDCASCAGQACAPDINSPASSCNNDLCTSGFCTPDGSDVGACGSAGYDIGTASCCLCQNTPRIDWISPVDGAIGNFVTIGGRYFGDTPGKVYFWDGSDYTVEAQFPNSVNANCNNNWQNNQIIVIVPDTAVDGPIKVVGANGYEDTTDNERGAFINDFDINEVERPGLCDLEPEYGIMNEEITYQGINLLNSTAYFGSMISGVAALNSVFSNDANGTAKVPNIMAGRTNSFVLSNEGINGNYLRFTKDPEPYTGPAITSFEPAQGAAGQYVTIYGRSFGRIKGTTRVYFGPPADENEANYQFPEICAESVWSDNQIIVKVPSGSVGGDYTISMEISGQTINSENSFEVDNSLALTPSLCKIEPTMGPNNSEISLWGENFGTFDSAKSKVRFNSNKDQSGTAITFWEDEDDAQKIETTVHQEASNWSGSSCSGYTYWQWPEFYSRHLYE